MNIKNGQRLDDAGIRELEAYIEENISIDTDEIQFIKFRNQNSFLCVINGQELDFDTVVGDLWEREYKNQRFLLLEKSNDEIHFRGVFRGVELNGEKRVVCEGLEADILEDGFWPYTISIKGLLSNTNRRYWWVNANEDRWDYLPQDAIIGQVQSYSAFRENGYKVAANLRAGDIAVIKSQPSRRGATAYFTSYYVVLGKYGRNIHIAKLCDFGRIEHSRAVELRDDDGYFGNAIGVAGTFFEIQEHADAALQALTDDNFLENLNTETKKTSEALSDNQSSVCGVAKEGFSYGNYSKYQDACNTVIYGVPGCGKSHELKNRLTKPENEDEKFKEENIFRTVFHPDYCYSDFVGQVMPKVNKNNTLKYEFVPGVFSNALIQAFEHPDEKVALVIEELNRGNASAIFGEIFQLLDRLYVEKDDLSAGTSEVKIDIPPLMSYLQTNMGESKYDYSSLKSEGIRIPSNLYLFATMNTSDQNVFTLDTAFKRRWTFERLSNAFNDNNEYDNRIREYIVPGLNRQVQQRITWEKFLTDINSYMDEKNAVSSEDKHIGKYFLSERDLMSEDPKAAGDKLLEYLWNDVAKYNRDDWFEVKTLDEALTEWENGNGLDIFKSELKNRLTENQNRN